MEVYSVDFLNLSKCFAYSLSIRFVYRCVYKRDSFLFATIVFIFGNPIVYCLLNLLLAHILCRRRQLSPGVYSLTPEGYVPVLKKLGVSCIVRFNSKCYDRNVFLVNGIR